MVLYMALLVMIPVAALTYGLMRVGVSFNNERMGSVEDEQTLFLADAGLAESVLALRNGGTGNIGSEAAPVYYGRGLYWVEVEDVGNDLLRLRSTAMYEGGRRSVQSLVFRKYDSHKGMTIFAVQDLWIESNAFFDSFDSALGDYADQVAKKADYVNDGVIIESNGNIKVDSSAEIYGDTHPGPGDDYAAHPNVELSGNQQPNPADRILDPVVVPAIPGSGNLTVGSGSQELTAGDYNFNALRVGVGAELTIKGPARVVVDDMELRSSSKLILDSAAGPIEFFISGDFVQNSNSYIDVTAKTATELTMNFTGGTDQVVQLESNSDFYGAIYAPLATVEVESNFRVFGAIVANSITVSSNCEIHYDEALKKDIVDPPLYIVATWSLAEFPVREYLANRSDPFRLVGVAPEDMDLPEEGRELP